jgi:hypothetical protein
VPRFGQGAQDRVRIKDGRGHQFWGLGARVPEHHALIAGAFVLVARSIDASRDVGRLAMDQALDRGALPVEVLLFVPDLADGAPCHFD